MNWNQTPIRVLCTPPPRPPILTTPACPFSRTFSLHPHLPQPSASVAPVADPTYMTKVFGLGGRCAAGGGYGGGAGGGILFQASGLVQPIFRRGVCRADPGRRWVLKAQGMQRCTDSKHQPRIFPALGTRREHTQLPGRGAVLRQTGGPQAGTTSSQ